MRPVALGRNWIHIGSEEADHALQPSSRLSKAAGDSRFLRNGIVFQAICPKGKVRKCRLSSTIPAKTSPHYPVASRITERAI
jgi:hypothetical protein